MSTLWLNSDGKLVVDATSGKAIICATCPCGCFPASDDFSGTGDNSGSIGDANYVDRWTDSTDFAYPTRSITGGKLHSEFVATTPTQRWFLDNDIGTFAGDFACKWDLTVSNLVGSGTPQTTPANYTILTIGGSNFLLGWAATANSSSLNGWFYQQSLTNTTFSTTAGTKSLEISRTGSTVYIKDGATTLWSGTKTGTVTQIRFFMSNTAGGSNRYSCHFDIDNFQLLDGSGNDLCIT